MKAEVGLLTRNIKVKGDSESAFREEGPYLRFSGVADQGLQVHVSFS